MTILEALFLYAPEFKNEKEELILQYIELSKNLISQKKFGKLYNQASALLTAHHMKMAGLGDNPFGVSVTDNKVSSYSEGDASISFNSISAAGNTSDAEYTQTTYGLQFIQLRKKAIVPIVITGVN